MLSNVLDIAVMIMIRPTNIYKLIGGAHIQTIMSVLAMPSEQHAGFTSDNCVANKLIK